MTLNFIVVIVSRCFGEHECFLTDTIYIEFVPREFAITASLATALSLARDEFRASKYAQLWTTVVANKIPYSSNSITQFERDGHSHTLKNNIFITTDRLK